jgi:hypothetical protein
MLSPEREKRWRNLMKVLPAIVINLDSDSDSTFELKELFDEIDSLRAERDADVAQISKNYQDIHHNLAVTWKQYVDHLCRVRKKR